MGGAHDEFVAVGNPVCRGLVDFLAGQAPERREQDFSGAHLDCVAYAGPNFPQPYN